MMIVTHSAQLPHGILLQAALIQYGVGALCISYRAQNLYIPTFAGITELTGQQAVLLHMCAGMCLTGEQSPGCAQVRGGRGGRNGGVHRFSPHSNRGRSNPSRGVGSLLGIKLNAEKRPPQKACQHS